jgi:hypothetical protein
MPQPITEGEAVRVLEAARARLATVEEQRRHDTTFLTSIRLAHAKAMVQAAERLLQRARQPTVP